MALLALLSVVVLLAASWGAGAASAVKTSLVTLTPEVGAASAEPADFWGVDLADILSAGPNVGATLLETPTTVLVYPAGNLTERTDFMTNTIYAPHTAQESVVTVQDFISDCNAISCQAIMELPMEIDNISTTAAEAEYVVNTLGFHPAYFAYGNEPSTWKCFGLSWSAQAAGHSCNTKETTPTSFATETQEAISAVSAALGSQAPPALCMNQGTGTGWQNNTPWLDALEANSYDNTNCAAYAMHVKAAHSQTVDPTLASFYATLTSPQGLPADYQNLSVLTNGKPLLLTEVGWTTPNSAFEPVFNGTWAENIVQTALIVQAMQNVVPTMSWWAWNEGYSLHNDNQSSFWGIYTNLLTRLGPVWYSTQFTGQRGVFAEVTKNGSAWSVLIVSSNIQRSFTISLKKTGIPLSEAATIYTVTASGTATTSVASLSSGVTLPHQSVVLITVGSS
ncbi:MAG: hypothetical protein WA688_08265 [Thermoplasmata archaeon]